jgi:hypothetical protein
MIRFAENYVKDTLAAFYTPLKQYLPSFPTNTQSCSLCADLFQEMKKMPWCISAILAMNSKNQVFISSPNFCPHISGRNCF